MNILILGGGGFIGAHLAKRLKSEGHWIRIVDLKRNEYFADAEICHEFIQADLREPAVVARVMFSPTQCSVKDKDNSFDEVFALAADMGGALYIFSGENDANVMHNSALININVSFEAVRLGIKRLFYSSSACIYPAYNQEDPDNPNCEERSAYPAAPDSEYGWEKLFSERLFKAFERNYGLDVRIARFHNIMGEKGTWYGGKEKAPAAICRKIAEAPDGGIIEIWGDGQQTRSFLHVDECCEGIIRLMRSDCKDIVNIGSEEMISINDLTKMVIKISGKNLTINNVSGKPVGVRGRNSHNALIQKELGWSPSLPLEQGVTKLYKWVNEQVKANIINFGQSHP
jgi:nucleoside-diphosphate-sugar epimerase